MVGRLTALQREILRWVAGVQPRWRLGGGAALAGFYTGHRATRDLDLFWAAAELGPVAKDVESRLMQAGLRVDVLQTAPAFRRLSVARGDEVVIVDLVAEPTGAVVAPLTHDVDGAQVEVDAPHELLVSKLCALLGRSELRDLDDVRALLARGGDLVRALADAPAKDAGFSPVTLAWVLEQLPVAVLARALSVPESEAAALESFRGELVAAVLAAARPE